MHWLYGISPRTQLLIRQSCIGFCSVPSHPMFKSRLEVTGPNMAYESMTLCSPTIIDYMETFKFLFTTYCYWHSRLFLLQICIILFQIFKLPADTAFSDSKRAENEKKRWLD